MLSNKDFLQIEDLFLEVCNSISNNDAEPVINKLNSIFINKILNIYSGYTSGHFKKALNSAKAAVGSHSEKQRNTEWAYQKVYLFVTDAKSENRKIGNT